MTQDEHTEREDFDIDDAAVQVERRARAGVVISVRLSREEADRLHEAAKRRNKTLSQTARDAIVGFLRGGAAGAAGSPLWTMTSTGNAPVYLTVHGSGGGVARTTGEGREVVAKSG